MNKKITLLGINANAIKYYGVDNPIIDRLFSLNFPLEVEIFSEKRDIFNPKIQFFTKQIEVDEEIPPIYNLVWFITDNDEINNYCETYWNIYKIN